MDHQAIMEKAIREWAGDGHNDSFGTDFNSEDEGTIHVHIYHHETFPQGGQSFTVDLRPERDSQTLLERRRVTLVDGQETLLQA